MIVEVDGFGNYDLPEVIEAETVVLKNHKEPIWDMIDFDSLEAKYPHVNWVVEDNTYIKRTGYRQRYHRNLPFYFLQHVIWRAVRIEEGDDSHVLASTEGDFGPRRFCFLNNMPRAYRVKLWQNLESDGLLNEYCSLIMRGIIISDANPEFDREIHLHEFSMRPPTFYDQVRADLFCETEVKGLPRFTEKTWKPLFYGKIPLAFGPRHYYKTLTDSGFKFPTYLDYTFDDIEDTAERFDAFYEQVKRFIGMPLESITDDAEHNRRRCLEMILPLESPPDMYNNDGYVLLLAKRAEEYLINGKFLHGEERERFFFSDKSTQGKDHE